LQLYHIGFSFYSTVTRVATRRDTTCYNTEVELRRAAKHATRGCSFIRSAATVSRRPGAALRYNRASTRLSSRRAGSVGRNTTPPVASTDPICVQRNPDRVSLL
jgi:hypothetical protein